MAKIPDELREWNRPLRVVCSISERQQIEANAKAAKLSVSAYLRNLGTTGGAKRALLDEDNLTTALLRVAGQWSKTNAMLETWLNAPEGRNRDQMIGTFLAELAAAKTQVVGRLKVARRSVRAPAGAAAE